MKSKNTNNTSLVNIFLVLLSAATFTAIVPNWANAKSLKINENDVIARVTKYFDQQIICDDTRSMTRTRTCV